MSMADLSQSRGGARLAAWLTEWPRGAKRALMAVADAAFVTASMSFAFVLKFDAPPLGGHHIAMLSVVAAVFAFASFLVTGLYHSVVRFLGSSVSYALLSGVLVSAAAAATFDAALDGGSRVPVSVFVIYAAFALLTVGGSRLLMRHFLNAFPQQGAQPLIIFGAGAAGRQIAAALMGSREYRPVAFADDQRMTHGALIGGLQVYPPARLPEVVRRWKGVSVLLAIPSASRKRRQEILESLVSLGVQVRSLPDMSQIVAGEARIEDIRELDVTDILGRDAVSPNSSLFSACIRNRSVMVTGAGGSIGSEICRQILRNRPKRLVLLELSEIALYNMERELQVLIDAEGLPVELVPLLGDAKRRDRVLPAMQAFGVQTVYHAAAYKHVPIVEHNVVEGIQNNVFSTWVTAEAAMEAGVETFVLVSTDKAVNPTNVMGATKRVAELVLQGMQERTARTRFAMVRFGNVLASSGSVVPVFQEQIRKGGPVTVTHPEVIRYFMTIPEAAQLVIQAGAMAQGGDVFLLDMGQPVRIVDLARRMISLAGRTVRDAANPHGDIEIKFTGLRPAEKLYEELLIGKDVSGTEHPMIMRAVEERLPWAQLEPLLLQIAEAARHNDCSRLFGLLRTLVTGYAPTGAIYDLVWIARGRPAISVPAADPAGKVTPLPTRRPRPGDQTVP